MVELPSQQQRACNKIKELLFWNKRLGGTQQPFTSIKMLVFIKQYRIGDSPTRLRFIQWAYA